MPGGLYGIGVGPGDPELVTVKALRRLRAAPVLAYPAPEEGDSFARGIVAGWLDGTQREIALRFPMRPGPPPEAIYDAGAAAIAAELERGADVALICQGDPLFYGSFVAIFARLAGRYRVEIISGVSSLTAAAAAAGLPLASRDETLTVIPATLPEADLADRVAAADHLVIVKLGRHAAKLRAVLGGAGLLDRAVYVEHATLPSQRIAPFAAVDPATAPYFSMVLVCR